ncbi:MAG: DUF1631 family protein [Alcanivoracaceae bacterium]|nr:DUF1631 family protein [Alcanivoracaceae bacterium]
MNSSTSKIGHNNLISSSILPFKATLLKSCETAISNTLHNLFSQAENATSNQQETRLFEQYNLLKKTSSKLLDSLAVITQSMPDEITEQISLGQETLTLSLVADEELEISLAFTQLESVLDVKFTKYLYALEKRLKVLFASKNISKSNMPFGITSVCWIFSQTLDLCASNISTKIHLIGYLKKELAVDLLEVYRIIDKKFVQAGILPNIRTETKPIARNNSSSSAATTEAATNPSSTSRNSNTNNEGWGYGATQQSGTVPNSNAFNQTTQNQIVDEAHTKSTELVNSIFNLMNNGRIQGMHPMEASNIDNSMMDQTLENLSKITSLAAGSTEIDKLKEMILGDVRNQTGIYYPSLSKEQQNSLDVMGMFYEQVREDNSIDGNIVSSLNAINIPLIRTAINDQGFFNNNNHPAREYLEKIIYASQKWHGTSVVKNLHKFSSNIASEFDGTTKPFDKANEELDSYLRLIQRRAVKAEEKWVNAAKGKEKLEMSRHKVEEIVENVSQNAVPTFVKNVIKYVIQDALTLSLLRHGEDSDEWHKNINTSTIIAKMANPKLVKELTPKQKIESLHHLDQTMDELGFSENDRTKTLNNIKDCTNAAMTGDLDENIKLQEVVTINKNKKDIKKAGSVKLEELRPLTAVEKTELTKIRLMPYGTLFDFIINQQREKIRRKLSWFSPVSNKALFVSLMGNRPYEKSLNAIAIDIARKNIIVVKIEKKKYFDQVLGDIFSKLKGLVNFSTKAR